MRIFQSIRLRIIFACLFFAIIINICFGYLTFKGLRFNVDEVFNWYIAKEVETLLRRYHENPNLDFETVLLADKKIAEAIISNEAGLVKKLAVYFPEIEHDERVLKVEDIKKHYNHLVGVITNTEQGFTVYEMDLGGGELHVIKAALPDSNDKFLYYLVDVSGFENVENFAAIKVRQIFIQNLILVLVIGLLLGLLLAKQVVSPLTRLTKAVEIKGDKLPIIDLDDYYNDEVGSLAKSINSFVQRTTAFLIREKAFSRDASHELRTPIASSRVALELAQTLPQAGDEKMTQYLSRIERANKNMTHLIETFLLLGQEQSDAVDDANFNLSELVDVSFQKQEYLRKNNCVSCFNKIDKNFMINGPEPYVSIIVDNLIRNALQHTESGFIAVYADHSSITVEDTGEGFDISSNTNIESSVVLEKAGFGLSIVQRICSRQNWSLHVASTLNKGTRVIVSFDGQIPVLSISIYE